MVDFHKRKRPDPEQEYFSDLFARNYNILMKEAWGYFHSAEDVEDAVQETITKLMEKPEKLLSLDPRKQTAYMVATLRNLSLSILRHRECIKFVLFSDLGVVPLPGINFVDPGVLFDRKEEYEEFRQIWHTLSVEDRMLLERKYILEESDAEIARDLNIKPRSVSMALTRSRRRAQAKYQQQWQKSRQGE